MKPEVKRYRLRHRARPLDVWVAGEGRPLLLLHGWGLSGRAYRGAMLALADRGFMVAAPSLTVAEDWSIDRVAESAAEAMAGVDAAPAPVVGHSFGGAVGAHLSLNHPDFATALVAVNSPLVSLGSLRMGRIVLPGRHYLIAGHGPAAAALMRSAATGGGMRSLLRSARWFLGAGQDRTLTDLAATGIPRAIIWAKHDALLPAALGTRAAELLGCDLHIIGTGNGWPGKRPPDHDWPFREPEHFAATIESVIASLARDAAREEPAP